jgi:hypothetical protein
MLHERAITQWRDFVATTVLTDYQKTSRLSHNYRDGGIPSSWLFPFYGLIDSYIAPSQPSWSLMQALLLLASYLHSVDTPSYPSRLQNPTIVVTTLGSFTTSLVEALATSHQTLAGQHDSRAKVWDLKFLRWLLALWSKNWDGLSELDELIEKLQVRSPPETYDIDISLPQTIQPSDASQKPPHDDAAVIEQHLLRTQILLAPLLPPVVPKAQAPPNKSSTKDTRTESLLQFGVPAIEQTSQPVMDLAKPGPRFGSLLVGSTVLR